MSKSKMNDIKKTLALIALFAISAIIFLNFQVKDVKADSLEIDIPLNDPINDPNNENDWHWHIDVQNGTEYIYETTFVAQNKTTREFIWATPTKFYFDFNISIFNATINWHDKPCFFSVINATERYYNESLGKTSPYPMSSVIVGGFQYNNTIDPIEFKERIVTNERFPIPFFLPINGTYGQTIADNKNINKLADIINKSIFYPYFAHGMDVYGFPLMNLWNDIEFPATGDPDTRAILFTNESGYKCRLEYYLNGTLENGELFAELLGGNPEDGPETLVILNLTVNRIFDPNPINEVEWGVEEGDIIYFGLNEGKANYGEYYLNITVIDNETEPDSERLLGYCFLYDDDPCVTYQVVIGTMYEWNELLGKYEIDTDNDNIISGLATDYMPYLGVMVEDRYGWVIPNNTNAEDFLFYTNRWFIYASLEEFSGVYDFEFKDDKNYYKVDGTLGSSKSYKGLMWYDKSAGVLALWTIDDLIGGDWARWFVKENHTLSSENHLKLNTKLLNNINITANITTTGVDSAFVIGLLPVSPVNETLPYGTPLVFVDWLITNPLTITSMNMTIKLPASIDLDNLNIQFWTWNDSEAYNWAIPPIDLSQIVKINYTENSITIIVPNDQFVYVQELIMAISYTGKVSPPSEGDDGGGGAEEPAAAIPGFDLWILFGVIGLVSLIALFKKAKICKITRF